MFFLKLYMTYCMILFNIFYNWVFYKSSYYLNLLILSLYLYNYFTSFNSFIHVVPTDSNLYTNTSIVLFSASQITCMIVRKHYSTTSTHVIKHKMKKFYHTKAKVNQHKAKEIYAENVKEKLKEHPAYINLVDE